VKSRHRKWRISGVAASSTPNKRKRERRHWRLAWRRIGEISCHNGGNGENAANLPMKISMAIMAKIENTRT